MSEKLKKIFPTPIQEFVPEGRGIIGLSNLGNTCYLNAAIQCLSNTIPLTEYLLKGLYSKYLLQKAKKWEKEEQTAPEPVKLFITYLYLLDKMWEKEDGNGEATESNKGQNYQYVLSPVSFTKIFTRLFPEGGLFRQNDSQEAIVFILDTMHEMISRPVTYKISGTASSEFGKLEIQSMQDWSSHFKGSHSFILDTFYGQEHLRLKCLNCEKVNHKFLPFMYTCVPVKEESEDIYDCFTHYCELEQLEEENSWECDNCKMKTQAWKKTSFWHLPEIFIITLKRFQVTQFLNYTSQKKNKHFIKYPILNLDMSAFTTNPTEGTNYNLYSVCCHIGSSNFGHYYNYCLNPNGKWYFINDDDVEEVEDLLDVVTRDAYILFYQKTK